MSEQPTSKERVSGARLEHLIRIAEMDCRQTSALLKDDGYSEGNVPAAQLRALIELRELRAEVDRLQVLVETQASLNASAALASAITSPGRIGKSLLRNRPVASPSAT